MTNATTFQCADCKQIKPILRDGGTGYATYDLTTRVCYACCAVRDAARMEATGKATLYLVQRDGGHVVTNWPGTLCIPVKAIKRGKHNMARVRYDAWFSHAGQQWHGFSIGEDTQLIHCKRMAPPRKRSAAA